MLFHTQPWTQGGVDLPPIWNLSPFKQQGGRWSLNQRFTSTRSKIKDRRSKINLLISSNSLLAAPVLGRPQELPELHQHQRHHLRDLLPHKSDFYQVRSFLADMICEYPQTIEVPEKSTLTFTLFALLSVSEWLWVILESLTSFDLSCVFFTSLCQPGGQEVFHDASKGQLTLNLPTHCRSKPHHIWDEQLLPFQSSQLQMSRIFCDGQRRRRNCVF